VTGGGFFDTNHVQDGLAPNCIEIHPVLKISIVGTEGTSAIQFLRGRDTQHTCGTASNARAER